ncbi:hypothetical protein ACFVTF_13855 [Kitasatospora sp. NPDC057940]|uniref:hypothetical protein n=1 Tax=Kitasatospora sp. NPDC057940 TaxID=3346285 RepID=UPI0036DF6F77
MTTANTPNSHRTRARRRFGPAAHRRALLAAGAVLTLGAGLTACDGGAALCLDDDSCDVVVRTDDAEAAKSLQIFGGDRTVKMTVSHITDSTAEVAVGDERKTVGKGAETAVGAAKVTLRKADKGDRYAELHVTRG